VEATDEAEAGKTASQLLHHTNALLDMIRNTQDNPPELYVAQVRKNESNPLPPLTVNPSLAWYLCT
jgi:hypothetical protein